MATHNRLRRCLPRPTEAIRIEKQTNETIYADRTPAVVGAARDILARNPAAFEVTVMTFGAMEGGGDGLALRCHLDDDAVRRLLREVSSSQIRRPFERRAAVHEYRIDGTTLSVERRCGVVSSEKRDVLIRCWEERCCEMEVMDGFAVAATRRRSIKPHAFPSTADLHSREAFERLTIECGSGIRIVLDCFQQGASCARVIIRKMDYSFPYQRACSAVQCLTKAGPS
jgi:hypothetical protein